jgi:hypothetical protein
MTAATQARLREALEARLGEAAALALGGMPPDARLRSLANALGGEEDAALAFLAEASGLEVLPEPAVDAEGVRAFPARLAARAQAIPVLLPGAEPGRLDLAAPWPPSAEDRAWAATFSPRRPRWFLAAADRVGQLVRESYGVGSGSLGDDEGRVEPDTYRHRPVDGHTAALSDSSLETLVSTSLADGKKVSRDDFDQLLKHLAKVHPSKYLKLIDSLDLLIVTSAHKLTDQSAALQRYCCQDRYLYLPTSAVGQHGIPRHYNDGIPSAY